MPVRTRAQQTHAIRQINSILRPMQTGERQACLDWHIRHVHKGETLLISYLHHALYDGPVPADSPYLEES